MSQLKKLLSHKTLFLYTILSYIDKLIVFATPIFILFLFHDNHLYNDIEYILSIANIVIVFSDFGFKPYYFYGYKEASNKGEFLSFSRNYYLLLFASQTALSIVAIIIAIAIGQNGLLLACILNRVLFLSYGWFFLDHFRLKEQVTRIFKITMPVNILSIIVMILLYKFLDFKHVIGFFVVQIAFNIIISFKELPTLIKCSYGTLFNHLKITLTYSFPVVLNILLINFLSNHIKIYTFEHFSLNDMTNLSMSLRIALIIQLTHSSAISYYSKQIFTDTNKGLNKNVLKWYSLMVGLATVLSILVFATNFFTQIFATLQFDITTLFIIASVIFSSYTSFFALYLSRERKNRQKLIFSIISVLFYFILLLVFKPSNVQTLILFMFIAVSLNLIQNIIYTKRLITG